MRLFLFLFVGFVTVQVGNTANEMSEEDSSNILSLNASIDYLISADMSCQQKTDCETIPLDDKACGGPEYWELTSKNNPHIGSIRILDEKRTEIKSKYPSGAFSNCMAILPPKFECEDNICTVKKWLPSDITDN